MRWECAKFHNRQRKEEVGIGTANTKHATYLSPLYLVYCLLLSMYCAGLDLDMEDDEEPELVLDLEDDKEDSGSATRSMSVDLTEKEQEEEGREVVTVVPSDAEDNEIQGEEILGPAIDLGNESEPNSSAATALIPISDQAYNIRSCDLQLDCVREDLSPCQERE